MLFPLGRCYKNDAIFYKNGASVSLSYYIKV